MRPVSNRFLRTLRGSHRMVADARVVPAGTTGVDPDGTPLAILGGDVRMDAGADIRSTLDLTVGGAGAWPTKATDALAPYGNEILVRRGIRYGDGSSEWVSLGYHRIYSVEQPKPPNGPIQILARDRMSGLVDARLLAPIQFGATATRGTVVAQLVTEVYPGATIEWDEPAVRDAQLGRALTAEEDRHGFLKELVTAVGKIWYWDHRGHLIITDPPSVSSPVWEVNAGANGVLVSMARDLSREGVYNAVVAYGEGTDTANPARAAVVDANPASPTYWYGSFGKVPRYYSSPFITTTAQASSAAASLLTKNLGLAYAVDFDSVPNAALEPYDPVRVVYPGRSEVHVIQSLTIPLVATGAMSAITREQTVILIGGV